MDYLPMFADLRGRPCLVVGGGEVAARKTRLLLRAGARVTVNAAKLGTELRDCADAGKVTVVTGRVNRILIGQHWLCIAATDDREFNAQIAALAAAEHRFCNVVDDADASGFIMPSMIDRAPLVIAISSGGESPVLARWLRQSIEAWLPTNIGRLARWAGDKRRDVQRRLTDTTRRLHFWQDVFDGPIADRVVSGSIDAAEQAFDRKLSDADDANCGMAWLIGAGPGDPDLITRRGMQLLQRADAVLYDRLASPGLLDLARRDAELINVGKSPDGRSTPQSEINRMLVDRVAKGQRVCRLKGGDPFIFGRGGEELAAMAAAGLAWQVVPGITAAQGCAASSNIPLTHRRVAESVSFVTGHKAPIDGQHDNAPDWPALADNGQTLVFYMSVKTLPQICASLIEHGRRGDTPVAIVENGTTADERVFGGRLENIVALATRENIKAPAVLIVGDVVALAPDLLSPAKAEVA